MKDLYIDTLEELISEYMDLFDITWDEAYEMCADLAYDRMTEKLADQANYLRMKAKESQ